ncbi:caspase a [Lepisosteus oculatus]|uniref:caspase a n=1 Tax=Lepisosteus oculatus TaxID=7918 RepID=UPI00371B1AC0
MADKKLLSVRTRLVDGLNHAVIRDLLDDLSSDGVLNDGEVEEVTEGQSRTRDKARCLVDMVRKKGSRASEKLLSRLQERDGSLHGQLELDAQPAQGAPVPIISQQETHPPGVLVPCTQQFYSRIFAEEADSVYPIKEKSGRKRLALIINNILFDRPDMERKGASKDEENMEKLLKDLGYTPETSNNLSAEDMEKTLRAFAKREEHKESDSTFVVIMSHGVRDGICGVHYQNEESKDVFPNDKIFEILNTQNCPGLRNKPKVILIQACRGEGGGYAFVSDSVPVDPMEYEDDALRKEHKEKDFICLCSSTPDNKSYRHCVLGTIFFQRIVEQFHANAHKDHIDELFRKVQNAFKDFPMQMPSKERTTLLKKFYLFPGL